MAKKYLRAYCVDQPLVEVPHIAIYKNRAPTATDRDFAPGDPWIYKSSADAATMYNFGGLDSNQDAIWILSGPGASEVDTLQGDTGGAIAPTAGNIVIAGGTNIATAGTSGPGTITINLDAAITLATSVTSPLYTAAAASDLLITAPTGQDGVIKMGDDAGSNKISFTDSGDAEVASIDSDGNINGVIGTFSGNLVLSSVATQIEMNGGAVTDFIGTGTLSSGTLEVANTNIAANDRIFLSYTGTLSDPGILTYSINAGSSFTVTSSNGSDASAFVYVIIRQN